MTRSKWKGPYVKQKLLKQSFKTKNNFKNITNIISKKSQIIPKFIGMTFTIYNGKNFLKINIIEEMVGYKLGEFIPTRKKFIFKKK